MFENLCRARAQGMLATLELLPMWSGVDPDVELFASGDVAEEDDEWKGGHSLDGSAAPAPDAGMYLLRPLYFFTRLVSPVDRSRLRRI